MAGFDIFLKLDGIDGEGTTKGHEKEIEVVSYDQSIDSTVPSGGGGGSGAGKSTFSGVRFRKLLDTASIPIALACASGLHIQSARFAFRRAPLDFYVVALEDVIVTHAGQCATTGAQSPLEFETLPRSSAGAALLEEGPLLLPKCAGKSRPIDQRGAGLPQSLAAGMWKRTGSCERGPEVLRGVG